MVLSCLLMSLFLHKGICMHIKIKLFHSSLVLPCLYPDLPSKPTKAALYEKVETVEQKGVLDKPEAVLEAKRKAQSKLKKECDNSMKTPIQRIEKGINKLLVFKKPVRRVKSASSHTKISYESDLSEGSKSCTNIRPASRVKNPKSNGPPEIIKRHCEKHGMRKRPPPKLEVEQENQLKVLHPPSQQSSTGIFSGTCQFCGKPIVPISSNMDLNSSTSEDQVRCAFTFG